MLLERVSVAAWSALALPRNGLPVQLLESSTQGGWTDRNSSTDSLSTTLFHQSSLTGTATNTARGLLQTVTNYHSSQGLSDPKSQNLSQQTSTGHSEVSGPASQLTETTSEESKESMGPLTNKHIFDCAIIKFHLVLADVLRVEGRLDESPKEASRKRVKGQRNSVDILTALKYGNRLSQPPKEASPKRVRRPKDNLDPSTEQSPEDVIREIVGKLKDYAAIPSAPSLLYEAVLMLTNRINAVKAAVETLEKKLEEYKAKWSESEKVVLESRRDRLQQLIGNLNLLKDEMKVAPAKVTGPTLEEEKKWEQDSTLYDQLMTAWSRAGYMKAKKKELPDSEKGEKGGFRPSRGGCSKEQQGVNWKLLGGLDEKEVPRSIKLGSKQGMHMTQSLKSRRSEQVQTNSLQVVSLKS